MSKVVIFGIGRGADVATRYFMADSQHEVVAYTVDDSYASISTFKGMPIVPFSKIIEAYPPEVFKMFIPLGFQNMYQIRAEKYYEAKAKGYELVSYVSSKVSAYEMPKIGDNCFILEHNIFNFDVTIGNNVVLWSANHFGDLCVIEDHVWISSHAVLSGEVTIGAYSFLGVNATVSNYVKVARKSYVGANALITKNTDENGVYIVKGTPKAFDDSDKFLRVIKV